MADGAVALESVGQISIIVKDVERARNFYRDTLGLKFLFEFPGMAFFDCGGVRLYLAPADKPDLGTSILYYRVADIRGTRPPSSRAASPSSSSRRRSTRTRGTSCGWRSSRTRRTTRSR